jgi:hypothetical protein
MDAAEYWSDHSERPDDGRNGARLGVMVGLYNNGYRLGNTPFTSRIGALTTIYNGQGVHGRSAVPTGWTRGILKLTTNYDSLPQGCRHPKAWMMPQKPGALASRNYATGSGTISADAWAVKLAEAAITGSGSLTAFGSLIVQLIASITGSGAVTNGDIKAFLSAVASLTGSGTISSAVRTGLGALLASVTGSGTAAGSTATGLGELDADIVAYGDLTPEGIRDAILNAIIESGLSLSDVQRILLAFAAGNATGLEGADPKFYAQDGSTVRIDGAYSGGTRTIDSLNGD